MHSATRTILCNLVILGLVSVPGVSGADPARITDAEPVAAPAADPGPGCAWIEAIAQPIAVSHFQDAKLQQTAGTLAVRRGGDAIRRGTVLATIIGQDADGTLHGNHHFLLGDGLLRTRNDRVAVKPTADKCVFDVESTLNVVDGGGSFAGLAGTLTARGSVNFCGSPGRITIAGKLCKAR